MKIGHTRREVLLLCVIGGGKNIHESVLCSRWWASVAKLGWEIVSPWGGLGRLLKDASAMVMRGSPRWHIVQIVTTSGDVVTNTTENKSSSQPFLMYINIGRERRTRCEGYLCYRLINIYRLQELPSTKRSQVSLCGYQSGGKEGSSLERHHQCSWQVVNPVKGQSNNVVILYVYIFFNLLFVINFFNLYCEFLLEMNIVPVYD